MPLFRTTTEQQRQYATDNNLPTFDEFRDRYRAEIIGEWKERIARMRIGSQDKVVHGIGGKVKRVMPGAVSKADYFAVESADFRTVAEDAYATALAEFYYCQRHGVQYDGRLLAMMPQVA